MTAPTTELETIRENYEAIVAAMVPAEGKPFERHHGDEDIRTWAERLPAGCARKFQIQSTGEISEPDISDGIAEMKTAKLELVVAYPRLWAGFSGTSQPDIGAVDRVIHADRKLLDSRTGVGMKAIENYVAGQQSSNLKHEIEEGRGGKVRFSVFTITVMFREAVGQPPAPESIYPSTGAELAAMMGLAVGPDSMWLFDGASGDFDDLVGANDLAVSGDVTRAVASEALQTDCVEFGSGVLSGGDIFDLGASDSLLVLIIWELLDTAPTGNLFSKGLFPGYSSELNGFAPGSLNWLITDGDFDVSGAGPGGLPVFAVGEANHTLHQFVRTPNGAKLISQSGSATNAGFETLIGVVSNGTAWQLGTDNVRIAFAAVWKGASAEQDITGAIAALRTAQGF